jgi:hypothetical protein
MRGSFIQRHDLAVMAPAAILARVQYRQIFRWIASIIYHLGSERESHIPRSKDAGA